MRPDDKILNLETRTTFLIYIFIFMIHRKSFLCWEGGGRGMYCILEQPMKNKRIFF